LVADAELIAQRTQMFFNQAAMKAVMTSRDGRVCREDGLAGNLAQGIIESHAVVVHPLANDLQRSKRTVAFVQVIDARRDAQRSQCLHPADAENQLLPNARPLVAAI